MSTVFCEDRRQKLCKRATNYYHTTIYVPKQKDYVSGFVHEPMAMFQYKKGPDEPLVSPDGLYDLNTTTSWLTVNGYNALVLNTCNMLIADIDFGDPRIDRFAGAEDCEEVLANMEDLARLDKEHMHLTDFKFAAQSYRIYRTHSGCRVICTSAPLPWEKMGWAAERFMRFLRSDPNYMEYCGLQKCYRARLTPKPWRDNGEPVHVCELAGTIGALDVAEELREQLAVHDDLTLPQTDYSDLA